MPQRQLFAFQIGCWATILTAVVHLLGIVLGGGMQPTTPEETELIRQATTVAIDLPGGQRRVLMDFVNGFSLHFSLSLALWGGLGLIVQRRGRNDDALMYAVARAMAGAAAALLVICLTYFFLIPSLFVALMAISFAISAVRAPSTGHDG
jgi:hypothetical protein